MNGFLQVYTIIANPIFCSGIENLIRTKLKFELEFVQYEELKQFIGQSITPNKGSEILIYEVQRFKNSDFNQLLNLKTTHKNLKILIITSHINVSDIKLLFEIGVTGIIGNNISPEEFIKFFKKSLKGEKVLSPEYWNLVIEYFFNSVEGADSVESKICDKKILIYTNLTKREKEILGYICDGKSTREISEQLFISLHTVETHRRKILTKLGVKNTASMVKVAIKSNLITV